MEGGCVFLFLGFLGLALAQQGPIVETTYGEVRGVDVPLTSGEVIQTWMGIPYAASTAGDMRFERPVPPEPWSQPLDCTDLGLVCPQGNYGGGIWDMYVNDEDCLHMNIYSKQRTSTDLLPVMVWIHGGGFNGGTNFEYPGYFFAEKDVVYVALNYRLGMFGFAYTGDGVLNGNQGIWDNILALEFIRDNIAAFGGDPNRVIIYGQSSGGCNVGILQSAPQAQGLFHGAILQSGVGIAPWAVMLEKFGPEDYMVQMANKYGCPTLDTNAMVQCLREQDMQSLADNDYVDCPTGSTACQGFQPVVDGELIPDIPILMRERGEFQAMPEMIGLTEEDGFGWGPSYIWDGLTREEMLNLWRSVAVWCGWLWPDQTVREDAIQAADWFYADWPYINDEAANRDMMGYFLTDFWYGASADYQAKTTTAAGQPTYFYVYKYMKENHIDNDWNGTPHSAEINVLFGYPLLEDNPEALAHSQVPQSWLDNQFYTQRDKEYSDYMVTLWTNFAKFWDPTPEPTGPAGGATIDWNEYKVGNLSYAYLDVESYTTVDYRQQEYAFQNRYLNYILYGREFYLE